MGLRKQDFFTVYIKFSFIEGFPPAMYNFPGEKERTVEENC